MRPVGKYSGILRIAVRGVCGLLAMRRETHGMVRSWHKAAKADTKRALPGMPTNVC
jgi:hypothetical protein